MRNEIEKCVWKKRKVKKSTPDDKLFLRNLPPNFSLISLLNESPQVSLATNKPSRQTKQTNIINEIGFRRRKVNPFSKGC
jgi:hypothetical protein